MQITDNIKKIIKNLSWTERYDIFAFIVLISGIIYSPFLFTVGLVLMALRILFIGKIKDKIISFKENRKVMIFLLSIYILNIIGLLWTENISHGLFELNHKLPFLIIPLFALCACPLKKTATNIVFTVYVSLITIGILIGITHYLIDPYADNRVLIPTARNISFAFHICFAVSVMLITAYRNSHLRKLLLPLTLLFCSYLFVSSLISGIITLSILGFIGFVIVLKKKNIAYSIVTVLLAVILISCSAYWLYKQYNDFFTPKEELTIHTDEKTASGNDYMHVNDSSIENGYYVNKYICPEEVEQAWLNKTGVSLNDYPPSKQGIENYRYADIIYRYLNSKGLRKDAEGVNKLTQKDIENIQMGYSNYVYAERFSLRPRLYQTFYEFERYLRTGEVDDMSIIQRYFWSKNAINIVKQHFFFGCGTGDTRDCLIAPVIDRHPELCTTGCNPHNQIIYIMTAFGLLGLVFMLLYFLYLPVRLNLFTDKYFTAFFVIAICWSFAESSFESYEGMTFISSLMSFFCLSKHNQLDKNNTSCRKQDISAT
ncbi:MAG: O-antigen ligase family protein [Bacteroidales bacterium]|nr:O-antigen ligase family protein [Bacteroidales bacterium]